MEGYQSYNQQNVDPNTLASRTSAITQFIIANDTSGSVNRFKNEMNKAMKELFMNNLKNSHKKNEIVVKTVTFGERVTHKSGFREILSLDDDYLDVEANDGNTLLYQGVLEALESVAGKHDDPDDFGFRGQLEDQGIEVRTAVLIQTDGSDTNSPIGTAAKVKKLVEKIRSREDWMNSFTITFVGVGDNRGNIFEKACTEMGLDPSKCLVKVSTSAQEIRKVIGVVSQSVSSSQGTQNVSF